MRAIWQACIEHNITPEINTKGLRCRVAEVHPAPESLRWYVEMGGKRLTFGSDAHRADNIADSFGLVRQMAQNAGLTLVCRFERRQIIGWSAI